MTLYGARKIGKGAANLGNAAPFLCGSLSTQQPGDGDHQPSLCPKYIDV